MRLRLTIGLTALFACATPLHAQLEGLLRRAREARPEPVEQQDDVRVETRYDQGTSWGLFAACDRNSDDRLDLFEASAGMVEIRDARDITSFRQVDRNRDGFVQWPEFDARFRGTTQIAGTFRIKPSRPVVVPADPTRRNPTPTIVEKLLEALDASGDGALDPDELREFVRIAKLEPQLADQFATIDLDRSGRLDATEFAPLVDLVERSDEILRPNRTLRETLPPRFQAADRDLDGVVSQTELDVGLRRIHPTLARWTDRILLDADLNGNGTLGTAEILRAARNATKPPAAPSGPRAVPTRR